MIPAKVNKLGPSNFPTSIICVERRSGQLEKLNMYYI